MLRPSSSFLNPLLLVGLLTLRSGAGAGPLSTEIHEILTDEFPEISVLVTVFSEAGRPVSGLTREAFTLSEEGVPVEILTVDLARAPSSLALVVDTSGSMGPSMRAMKDAAADLLRALDPEDRVTVISFGEKPWKEIAFTHDRRKVLDSIERLEARGPTAFHDALGMALDELRERSSRRFVVAFTDGQDQNEQNTGPQSVSTLKQVVNIARERRVPLFTIGLGNGVNRPLLKKLSRLTGGVSYHASDVTKLKPAFLAALGDFRQQYQIRYRSPDPQRNGTERAVALASRTGGSEGQGKSSYRAPAPDPAPLASARPEDTIEVVARPYAWIDLEGFDPTQICATIRIHTRKADKPWPPEMYNSDDHASFRKDETGEHRIHHQIPAGEHRVRVFPHGCSFKFALFEFDLVVSGKEDFLITPAGARPVAPMD